MSAGRDLADIDAILADWQQGDGLAAPDEFLYRVDPERPLALESHARCDSSSGHTVVEVPGLVVLTQTCDLIRPAKDRPYVEVAPMVEVPAAQAGLVEAGRIPRLAPVPGLRVGRWAADLDRVMTVEKGVVARWRRTPGCRSTEERVRLAAALARKRARFAFPDDFVRLVGGLQDHVVKMHSKQSPGGEALRSLREIRVRAEPDWEASKIALTLLFVRLDDPLDSTAQRRLEEQVQALASRIVCSGRYIDVSCELTTLDDLSARDYVLSQPLDLDHLSQRL